MTLPTLFVENGLAEMAQILTLLVGALAFVLSATLTRAPGGPFLLLAATVMGVAALREFDLEAGPTVLVWLSSSSPRTCVAAAGLIAAAGLALRRPRMSLRQHLGVIAPLAPPLGLAMVIVAVGDGVEKLGVAYPAGLLLEEGLELAGYGLAAWVAVRTAVRVIRRPGRPASQRLSPGGPVPSRVRVRLDGITVSARRRARPRPPEAAR